MKKIMIMILCGLMVGSVFADQACLTCIGKAKLNSALKHNVKKPVVKK